MDRFFIAAWCDSQRTLASEKLPIIAQVLVALTDVLTGSC